MAPVPTVQALPTMQKGRRPTRRSAAMAASMAVRSTRPRSSTGTA